MRTSTQIETASVLVGEEKAVEYVAKAGFDAWDFPCLPCAITIGDSVQSAPQHIRLPGKIISRLRAS